MRRRGPMASMPTKALGMIRKQVAAALTGTLSSTLEVEADHQSAAARTEPMEMHDIGVLIGVCRMTWLSPYGAVSANQAVAP